MHQQYHRVASSATACCSSSASSSSAYYKPTRSGIVVVKAFLYRRHIFDVIRMMPNRIARAGARCDYHHHHHHHSRARITRGASVWKRHLRVVVLRRERRGGGRGQAEKNGSHSVCDAKFRRLGRRFGRKVELKTNVAAEFVEPVKGKPRKATKKKKEEEEEVEMNNGQRQNSPSKRQGQTRTRETKMSNRR